MKLVMEQPLLSPIRLYLLSPPRTPAQSAGPDLRSGPGVLRFPAMMLFFTTVLPEMRWIPPPMKLVRSPPTPVLSVMVTLLSSALPFCEIPPVPAAGDVALFPLIVVLRRVIFPWLRMPPARLDSLPAMVES
ncbi:hypothetical protein D7V80_10970 [Corallococcus sp. CA054B]|nr:hypothetical protein D7V80_10970 [Corallococcus sp. CA054B]